MELHVLKIKNIASIADAEIDFSSAPLKDEPVFLICGDTGTGKSTILDAVCLALYNETPRMEASSSEKLTDDAVAPGKRSDDDTVKINDTRQFLRKGTGRGSVELTFAGNDGKEYLAVWSISRAYGKPDGKLQRVEWSVECDGTIWKTRDDVTSKIEAVTGMTFDQYCRTAMLAQGDFTRFLKSTEDDKAVILEKLTRTDIYSRIGAMIAVEYRKHSDAYERQHEKTEGIQLMDDTGKKEAADEIYRLEQESEICRKRKETASAKLQWLDAVARQKSDLHIAKEEYEKSLAEVSSESFRNMEMICLDWDSSTEQRAALDRIAHLSENLRRYEAGRKSCFALYASMTEDMKTKKNEIKAASENLQTLKDRLAAARNDESMFQSMDAIKSLLSQVAEGRGRNAVSAKLLEEAEAGMRNIGKEILKSSETKTSLEKRKASLQQEYSVLSDEIGNAGKERLASEKDRLTEKKLAVMEAAAAVRNMNEGNRRLDESLKDEAGSDAALKEARKVLEEKKKAFGIRDADFRQEQELYMKMKESAYDWARETRRKLKKGDICPVCGHTVDTVFSDEKFESLLKPAEERYMLAQERRSAAESALKQAVADEKSADRALSAAAERTVRNRTDAEKAAREAAAKCLPLSVSPDDRNAAEILKKTYDETETGIRTLSGQLEKITFLEKKAAEIYLELQDTDALLEKCRSAAEELNRRLETMKDEAVRLNSNISATDRSVSASLEQAGKLITRKGWEEQFDADASGFLAALERESKAYRETMQKASELEKDLERKTGMMSGAEILKSQADMIFAGSGNPDSTRYRNIGWDSLTNEWNMLIADARTIENNINAAGSEIRSYTEGLDRFHAEGRISPERLKMLHGCPAGQIAGLKSRLDEIRKKLTASKSALEQREKDLKALVDSAPQMQENDTREHLQEETAGLEETSTRLNQQIGAIRHKLLLDEQNCILFRKEKEKEKELESACMKWENLYKLLGDNEGKKFKKIAQSFILSDLIRNANTYLGHLSGRYVLDNQSGSLTITVRDMYQGGAERSVNTLSGGESFLVSLALALGLSSLAANTLQVSTLFIDEGFGTLSAECLNTVMEALENLHQMGGKKVGIISHVEALRERIPVKIQLTRQGNSSSRVSIVTA